MILRVLALIALAGPAAAFTPPVAGPAQVTRTASADLDSVTLPLGPWTPDAFPTETVEGRITRTAWQTTPPAGFTTLSILQPIREALEAEGWTLRLDCETEGCGGYDFRYSVPLFPEPQMHVDLGDFRYLSAAKGASRLGVMVSRTADLGFIEVVQADPPGAAPPTQSAPQPAPQPVPEQMPDSGPDFAAGPTVLEGLDFSTGASALSAAQPVLEPLLTWLRNRPQAHVTLVGHTDSSGDAAANLALSQARAAAVRDWLVARGIAPARLDAQGVGALAPRDTNATEEGRARNRRVEVLPQ